MWYYNDEPFNMSEEDLENYQGFVYEVTELETGMKYIGKKFFWKKKILVIDISTLHFVWGMGSFRIESG